MDKNSFATFAEWIRILMRILTLGWENESTRTHRHHSKVASPQLELMRQRSQ